MGRMTAQALLDKSSFEVVGAIDIASELFGKDLGDLFDSPSKLGVAITKDVDKVFFQANAQAVILTTSSHITTVFPQITQCVKAGLNVISTSEELSFPWNRDPDLAENIDRIAKENGVTVVGTGINPGYLMDILPLMLTAPCLDVQSIKVTRMMNSAKRRRPFQVKVGTGLSKEEFNAKIENKSITGHVGLLESIHMMAAGLGWNLDEATELPPEPVISQNAIETALGEITPGCVIGLKSIAYGKRNGKKAINLEFCANAGVVEEYDEIVIEGKPRIHQKIIGGVHGDIGTVAMTINTIPRAIEAPAGLQLVKDLPPPIATQ
jgi:4-hydroxy-tetrahydrodipicolinate reductase